MTKMGRSFTQAGGARVRARRLAGTIRKHLSEELTRELADPRLSGLGIHEVELSADLSMATILVRIDYGDDDDSARRATLATLQRLAPRLRASLAPRLRIRRVPELRFRYDVGQDHVRRIAEVLAEIREEDAQRVQDASQPEDPKED